MHRLKRRARVEIDRAQAACLTRRRSDATGDVAAPLASNVHVMAVQHGHHVPATGNDGNRGGRRRSHAIGPRNGHQHLGCVASRVA